MLDDASTIASLIVDLSHLLNEVTAFGSRLIAFPPLLLTFEDQSPAIGWCCLPSTGEVGVDDFPRSGYHLTYIDTQLSKNSEPFFAAHSPALPVSDERIAPMLLHTNCYPSFFRNWLCLRCNIGIESSLAGMQLCDGRR